MITFSGWYEEFSRLNRWQYARESSLKVAIFTPANSGCRMVFVRKRKLCVFKCVFSDKRKPCDWNRGCSSIGAGINTHSTHAHTWKWGAREREKESGTFIATRFRIPQWLTLCGDDIHVYYSERERERDVCDCRYFSVFCLYFPRLRIVLVGWLAGWMLYSLLLLLPPLSITNFTFCFSHRIYPFFALWIYASERTTDLDSFFPFDFHSLHAEPSNDSRDIIYLWLCLSHAVDVHFECSGIMQCHAYYFPIDAASNSSVGLFFDSCETVIFEWVAFSGLVKDKLRASNGGGRIFIVLQTHWPIYVGQKLANQRVRR